jgi:hypothetical protein
MILAHATNAYFTNYKQLGLCTETVNTGNYLDSIPETAFQKGAL